MTRFTGTARIVISMVVLALAGAVALMVVVVTRSTSSGMTGMSHGSSDMSMSAPATTATADPHGGMPGMDMSGTEHGSDATLSAPPDTTAEPHGEMPGMEMPGMDMSGGEHATEVTPTAAPTTSADAHGEMPGMDMSGGEHGTEVTPTAAPTGSGEMPGMDMGSGDTHGTTPGHDSMAEEAAPVRPIVPVLSTFGGGTSAVLLGAGLLRRKDRIRNQAKAAARAARRSAK